MAAFCLGYGMRPKDYMKLTRLERQAFHNEAQRISERRRR